MGYANKTVTLDFPDLSEEGDPIFIKIRNPKTVPMDALRPKDIATDDNGRPVNTDDAIKASFEILAGLIIDWHVYDGSLDEDVLLDLPATADSIAKLPLEIQQALQEQVTSVIATPQ